MTPRSSVVLCDVVALSRDHVVDAPKPRVLLRAGTLVPRVHVESGGTIAWGLMRGAGTSKDWPTAPNLIPVLLQQGFDSPAGFAAAVDRLARHPKIAVLQRSEDRLTKPSANEVDELRGWLVDQGAQPADAAAIVRPGLVRAGVVQLAQAWLDGLTRDPSVVVEAAAMRPALLVPEARR